MTFPIVQEDKHKVPPQAGTAKELLDMKPVEILIETPTGFVMGIGPEQNSAQPLLSALPATLNTRTK